VIIHRLTPGQLALAVAFAALFSLLLYLLRERRRTVRVPYLPLVEEALARRLPTGLGPWLQRLKSWAVQVAVIVAALLAFADAEESEKMEIRHEARIPRPPHEMVLVLDRSLSMGARRPELDWCGDPAGQSGPCALRPSVDRALPLTLDRARARAAELLASQPEGSRVLVASLDETVHIHALWVSPAAALRALDEISLTHLADDPVALGSWLAALRRAHPRAELRALTDLHRTEAWGALRQAGVSVDGVGTPLPNLLVSALGVRADAEMPGRVEVHCRVGFSAPPERGEAAGVLLEIAAASDYGAANPVPLATRRLLVEPGGEVGVDLALEDVPGHLLRARAIPAQPDDDAIEADSLRWAEVPALRPAPVSLVGSAGPALLAALAADPYMNLVAANAPSAGSDTFASAPPVRIVIGLLPDSIEAPTLLLLPPVDPDRELAGVAAAPSGQLTAERHPIWGALDPGNVTAEGGVGLLPSGKERGFLSLGGMTVGVAGSIDSFAVVRLGLDPEDPSLSETAFLPALLARLVDYLVGRSDEMGVEHAAGDVDPGLPEDPVIKVSRLDTGGDALEVAGGRMHLDRAGPYLLHRRSGATEALVVVPPRDRSESPTEARTDLSTVKELPSESAPRRASLWWVLVLGLCITCLVEHLLFVRRRLL
jgi:hypothetical protein